MIKLTNSYLVTTFKLFLYTDFLYEFIMKIVLFYILSHLIFVLVL